MKWHFALTTNTPALRGIHCFPISELNILCSFEYQRTLNSVGKIEPQNCKHFIGDSGAYTAMASGKKIDDDYIARYIEWVNDQHIDHFIEMDLDEIVGYDNVLKIRKRIEARTGKQTIPVWHLSRGKQGWIDMCNNYDYVALSLSLRTQSSKWLRSHDYRPLKWFLDYARTTDTKVHALGCGNIGLLTKYHFYSADSSNYTLGGRCGKLHIFTGTTIVQKDNDSKYKIDYEALNIHNVKQWKGFMDYAEQNL